MQTPSGCVHLGAAGSRRLRRAHFVGWLRGSGSQRTSYFLFNSWTRKGLQSSSDPHFVAGSPSLTPTKIPVPVGLSEKAEGTSGAISRYPSNWVWWLEPGLVTFNWGSSFWKETACRSCLGICGLQVQSEIAVGDFQGLTGIPSLLHCHPRLSG